MQNFFEKLDNLAAVESENALSKWLERVAFVFIILMFVAAPHSIAATQTAWLTGMFIWVIRLFIRPRPRLVRTPLDIPLWIFFGWSLLSSIFSYDPLTSLDKLRLNVALFLIFYFVINVVRTKRAVVFLAGAMIFSAMVSVVWTPIERFIGRGVEISGVAAESLLTKAKIQSGDTLLEINGKKIKTPDELLAEIEAHELSKVTFYRPDYYLTVDVWRKNLLGGETALEKLGFADWKRSRNWRSAGFYGHYATFAEVLQLIASLTLGLFLAHFLRRGDEETGRQGDNEKGRQREEIGEHRNISPSPRLPVSSSPRLPFSSSPLLLFCVVTMALALLLTVTRASQLAFLIAATAMILISGNRKMLLIAAAIILPVALGGLIFLQQSREVGFFDLQDDSTTYRLTIYREAFDLWTANPRHFILGVGMDSIKKYAVEWRLFDDGKLPLGHFHSTPVQLLVERGLPALLLWLWVLWVYARTLLRRLKIQDANFENPESLGWREKGIILGSFGGMIGFFTSGLAHFNLGDAEVAMVFFMLMGLSIKLAISSKIDLSSN